MDASERQTVAELERVRCDGKCPALFTRLKEGRLFARHTLNLGPLSNAASEGVRSRLREGRSRAEAERESRSLSDDAAMRGPTCSASPVTGSL